MAHQAQNGADLPDDSVIEISSFLGLQRAAQWYLSFLQILQHVLLSCQWPYKIQFAGVWHLQNYIRDVTECRDRDTRLLHEGFHVTQCAHLAHCDGLCMCMQQSSSNQRPTSCLRGLLCRKDHVEILLIRGKWYSTPTRQRADSTILEQRVLFTTRALLSTDRSRQWEHLSACSTMQKAGRKPKLASEEAKTFSWFKMQSVKAQKKWHISHLGYDHWSKKSPDLGSPPCCSHQYFSSAGILCCLTDKSLNRVCDLLHCRCRYRDRQDSAHPRIKTRSFSMQKCHRLCSRY